MKVSLLETQEEIYGSGVQNQRRAIYRNHDARLKPLQVATEYQRALVATKMDRIFAKPYVASMAGHLDSVKCLARAHLNNVDVYSGSMDGEIRFWNLGTKKCVRSLRHAHSGFVQGLCVSNDDKYLFSCGEDKQIKQWSVEKHFDIKAVEDAEVEHGGHLVDGDDNYAGMSLAREMKPAGAFVADYGLTSIDHHDERSWFMTTGEKVALWDENRSAPVAEFQWGIEGFFAAKWSKSEMNLCLVSGEDNSVILVDVRQSEVVQKFTMQTRSFATCWNPMKPMNFICGCQDGNIYSFDMRRLQDGALRLHTGFVNKVLDLDFSPTGREFVAGSFDQTVRIWNENESKSKDVYHSRRQQQVLSTRYTTDGKYILAGSADMNIRIWKSNASEILGPMKPAERRAEDYRAKLKSKFAHMPEIKRIATQRHVPRYIKRHADLKVQADKREGRKEAARRERNPNLASRTTLKKSMLRKVEVAPADSRGAATSESTTSKAKGG